MLTAAVTSVFFLVKAGIGDRVAGGEIVRAIGDDVVAAHEIAGVRSRQPRLMCLDRDMRIERLHGNGGAHSLRRADIARTEKHLTLQVRQ